MAFLPSTAPYESTQEVTKKSNTKASSGNIYIGIGGWTFEPWRGVFYPEKLAQAKELSYAASKLTSIEINGTYYGSQKPESFRKWAREVPDGFVFSLKGPRFATNRRVLAEAGDSVKRFYDSGVLELGDRLGPVLWQFATTKKFDPTKQLDALAKRFQHWAGGGEPDDLPRVDKAKTTKTPRDVFAYVIHEGKVRAPAGAMELIERVK